MSWNCDSQALVGHHDPILSGFNEYQFFYFPQRRQQFDQFKAGFGTEVALSIIDLRPRNSPRSAC